RTGYTPWGCTSSCTTRAGRSACRWRSSAATGGGNAAPFRARRPPGAWGGDAAQRRGQVRERRRTRVVRPLVARAAPGVRVLEDQLFTCWHAKTSRGARRLHQLAQVGAVTIDIGGRLCLGRAHQQRMAEFGEVSRQIEPAEDAAAAQALEQRRHRTVEL